MQAVNLDEVTAALHLCYRTSAPERVKLLTPRWVKYPTPSPTIYSPDFSPLQIHKLTNIMGNFPSNLASFLVINMVQRAPYWRRAIIVIGA